MAEGEGASMGYGDMGLMSWVWLEGLCQTVLELLVKAPYITFIMIEMHEKILIFFL